MMQPLDLAPYLLTPGHRVITREQEGRRSRAAHARAAVRRMRDDPLNKPQSIGNPI